VDTNIVPHVVKNIDIRIFVKLKIMFCVDGNKKGGLKILNIASPIKNIPTIGKNHEPHRKLFLIMEPVL
jgi:hypothetical protein